MLGAIECITFMDLQVAALLQVGTKSQRNGAASIITTSSEGLIQDSGHGARTKRSCKNGQMVPQEILLSMLPCWSCGRQAICCISTGKQLVGSSYEICNSTGVLQLRF